MKIVADVQVNHRMSSAYNIPRRRFQRSTLSFTAKTGPSGTKDEVYLIHNTQNGARMYKVKDNLERVYDKFSNEGKITIQFKEPPHDLLIKSVNSLAPFVNALKMGYRGIVNTIKLTTFSKESTKKVPPKPKTHITILSKSQYPYTEGFPRSAISIVINGVEKYKFDARLLALEHLKVLDLSFNGLTEIPSEINILPSLTTLILHHNKLGTGSPYAWQWLDGDNIRKNLIELDLSANELSDLAPAVCFLRNLLTLKVSNNSLEVLPNAIGLMPALRNLHASCNHLEFLPGSVLMMRVLWVLDVSGNPFIYDFGYPDVVFYNVPSLMELASRTVVADRVSYSASDLPLVVRQYLDTVSFCQCRQPCFEAGIKLFSQIKLSSLAQSVIHMIGDQDDVPIQINLCSYHCLFTFNVSRMRKS